MNLTLQAVIWDFDGTLVDTRAKNLAVNRRIVETVTGRPYRDFPALRTPESYGAVNRRVPNWRVLYREAFGFDDAATDRAGRLWTEFQLADATTTILYQGIPETLAALGDLQHGIVSQNSAENIRALLGQSGLQDIFEAVIGYEEVAFTRQKPEPDGLLLCIEMLRPAERGVVLYVGDHATDAECAFHANAALQADGREVRVVAVAASFDGPIDTAGWRTQPEHVIHHPLDLVGIAERYPPC